MYKFNAICCHLVGMFTKTGVWRSGGYMMVNVFLKIFGKSNTMKVFDYLLDIPTEDVTVMDICEGTDLSRKTVDNIMKNLKEEKIVEVTRKIGKTELFKLNKENPICKNLILINEVVLKKQEEKVKENILIPA